MVRAMFDELEPSFVEEERVLFTPNILDLDGMFYRGPVRERGSRGWVRVDAVVRLGTVCGRREVK